MRLWSNGSIPTLANFNPEKRLLAAVLQRAITDYIEGVGDTHASAKNWLYNQDNNTANFGFSYICEALDFHKDTLRKAVRRQYEVAQNISGLKPVPKKAENPLELM